MVKNNLFSLSFLLVICTDSKSPHGTCHVASSHSIITTKVERVAIVYPPLLIMLYSVNKWHWGLVQGGTGGGSL